MWKVGPSLLVAWMIGSCSWPAVAQVNCFGQTKQVVSFGQTKQVVSRVEGQVFDLMGVPILGATVSLNREGRPPLETKTDPKGKFNFSIASGTFELRARSPGFVSAVGLVEVRPGIRSLFHFSKLRVVLAVGMNQACPSVTTSEKEFIQVLRKNAAEMREVKPESRNQP